MEASNRGLAKSVAIVTTENQLASWGLMFASSYCKWISGSYDVAVLTAIPSERIGYSKVDVIACRPVTSVRTEGRNSSPDLKRATSDADVVV